MKEVQVEFNGHDLRKGFTVQTFVNDEEHKQHDKAANYQANLARKRRLRAKSGLPRISTILIRTKIPQIFDKFIMPRAKRTCALGALHVEAGGSYCSDEPSWWMIERKFDVTDEELKRVVRCPHCVWKYTDSLATMIHHFNDQHRQTNKQIGTWLIKVDL